MTLAHAIGRQLEHPRGIGGWLTGHAMRVVNARPTALTIDALAVQAGDIVLDMGCGTGDALEALARKAGSGVVYALDQSDVMLAVARKRHARRIRAGSIVLNYGDFAALPFADASFDRVLASNVIYFWQDPYSILVEILRVLKPAGRLSIYATDDADMAKWSFVKHGTHILYTAAALDGLMAAAPGSANFRQQRVPVGLGVHGLIATLDRSAE